MYYKIKLVMLGIKLIRWLASFMIFEQQVSRPVTLFIESLLNL